MEGVEGAVLVEWMKKFQKMMLVGQGGGRDKNDGSVTPVLVAVLGAPKRLLPKAWGRQLSRKQSKFSVIALGSMGLSIPSRVLLQIRDGVKAVCSCEECVSATADRELGEEDQDTPPGRLESTLHLNLDDSVPGDGDPGASNPGQEPKSVDRRHSKSKSRDMEGPVAAATHHVTSTFRVLVAEDNKVNQKLLGRMLEKVGKRLETQHGVKIESRVVENGEDAVAAFVNSTKTAAGAVRKEGAGEKEGESGDGGEDKEGGVDSAGFDLILMDCHMPICDGYKASGRIRELEKLADEAEEGHVTRSHVPIVALTANVMEEERRKSLGAGMDHHLTKPVKPDEIEKLILCILEGYRNPDSSALSFSSLEA